MQLNESTEHSSNQLRTLADLVLGLGIFVSIASAIVSFISIYTIIKNLVIAIIVSFISFLIIFIWHYVGYVLISSCATFIENSDRTEVVDALDRVCDAIRGVDTVTKSRENDITSEEDYI